MRYIYACLKNYIGFFNGMGIDKVEIDFTKCRNNIILIHGANGTGKSTLMNALNPFPDPSYSFTPNKDGEKLLTLVDGQNIYQIKIISPADSKGGRKQSKAFISKNGVELNDNGNITSYKEIIFSEFEMDSNYSSLTKLSSNDRGLGDKTPAERKKFASSIVDNLETYNTIFKTLNKKSLIFKSHINTLHTKIQSVGSKENLEATLNALRQKSESISSRVLMLNNRIVELQTRASINQQEAQKIQDLKSKEASFLNTLSIIENELVLLKKRTMIEEVDIISKYEEDQNLKESYIKSREEIKTEWRFQSELMATLTTSLNELKVEVETQKDNIDLGIEKKYRETIACIQSLKKSILSKGIEPNTELIYKLSSLIDFYGSFIRKIDAFYDGLDSGQLEYIALKYDHNKVIQLKEKINEALNLIEFNKRNITDIQDKMKKISVLENRPNNCSINTCPFISEAYELKKEIGNVDLVEELSKLQEDNLKLLSEIDKLTEMVEYYGFCDKKVYEFDSILLDIIGMKEILNLFDDNLCNDTVFRNMIALNNPFNEQRDPRRFIDTLNELKSLESYSNSFEILKVEFESQQNKIGLIEKSKKTIEKTESDISVISDKIIKLKSSIDNYTSLIDSINFNIGYKKQYMDKYQEYLSIKRELEPIQNSIKEIEEKSSDSIKGALEVNNLQFEISQLNKEVEPITSDIHAISGKLTMLESYYQEYNLYQEKYNLIETLKKYCSPTGGGIQTIFMQLYMNKTLEIANQILGMLFNGEYQLLDFIINQNEFRIPFIGNGLPVDDISSGSTSQICIMGMAINLALFHQASTKFTIARLDELDSGLDNYNRIEFVNALYRTLPILNIEQLFIISHSIESDTTGVDIIKLKSNNNEDLIGNIIWDFRKEIDKTLN